MKTILRVRTLLTLLAALVSVTAHARDVAAVSPDGKLTVTLSDADGITLGLSRGETVLLSPSPVALDIRDTAPARRIKSISHRKTVTETVESPFYRQKSFTSTYNTLSAHLDNGTSIELRVFDDGMAYRFVTDRKGEMIIEGETADYRLPADLCAWLPYSTSAKTPMAMAFQNVYDETPISRASDKLAFLPVTIDYGDGLKLTLTESDLESYPGMFVKADTVALALRGVFAPYPAKMRVSPRRCQAHVDGTEDFIARTSGSRTFPWRVMAVTTDDRQMPVNNLVYLLAAPNRIGDISWIRGGKVAWDWWNNWGLKKVDFKAGINTETYKYFIDFASLNGIEYVILDEGWYDPGSGDMLTPIPDIDIEGLVAYGRERNVGIVLWTVFNVLDSQLDEACDRYAAMGVKGFKVDFLDRDDQTAVEQTCRIAEAAAKRHLILDLHGFYKPTGLNRTYPNIINFEAVFGMEEVKWTDLKKNMPLYDVTFPFIRLLAGPVDYTPGAMRNANKADWRAVYNHPVSMGTRCHQLATYIVYDSPFTMLCDAPTNYIGEEECLDLICAMPTDIDRTLILAGKIGEYIVTARRSGNEWWIGGLTNWDARELDIDLSFLPSGRYRTTLFTDGINVDRNAEDYAVHELESTAATVRTVRLASGGGFVMRLQPMD